MFLNQFPFDEDFETTMVIIKFVYLMIFYPISPSMGLDMREG